MSNEKIQITPEGDELTILKLEGSAMAPIPTKRYGAEVRGRLTAPYLYFSGKRRLVAEEGRQKWLDGRPFFDLTDMLVVVNRPEMVITWQENNHLAEPAARVVGAINVNPHLLKLGINSGKKYTARELADVLKMNRLLFSSREDNMVLIAQLMDFRARVEKDIQVTDDKRGNKVDAVAQTVTTKVDLGFNLFCPVLDDVKKVAFRVEINYDIRDRAAEFWLESVELHEYIQEESGRLIDEEVAKFLADGLTVIYE